MKLRDVQRSELMGVVDNTLLNYTCYVVLGLLGLIAIYLNVTALMQWSSVNKPYRMQVLVIMIASTLLVSSFAFARMWPDLFGCVACVECAD